MVIQLNLPDGSSFNLPDETTDAQLQQFIDENFNQSEQIRERKAPSNGQIPDVAAGQLAGGVLETLGLPFGRKLGRIAGGAPDVVGTAADVGVSAATGAAELPIGLMQRATAGLEAIGVEGAGIASLALGFLANPQAVLSDPELRQQLVNTDIGQLRTAQADAIKRIESIQKEAAKTSPVAAPVAEVVGQVAPFLGIGGAITTLPRAAGLGGATGTGVSFSTPTKETIAAEQELLNSVSDAVKGGLIGAATAGTIQQGLRGGSFIANKIANIIKKKTPESFSRAEQFLKRELSKLESSDIFKRIRPGNEDDISISLAQAANAPEISNAANILARSGTGAVIAKQSIENTAKQLGRAENQFLNELADNVTTAKQGADIIVESLDNTKTNLIKARQLQAAPLYDKAFKQRITPKTEKDLLIYPYL